MRTQLEPARQETWITLVPLRMSCLTDPSVTEAQLAEQWVRETATTVRKLKILPLKLFISILFLFSTKIEKKSKTDFKPKQKKFND
jgi:hypothetical protein